MEQFKNFPLYRWKFLYFLVHNAAKYNNKIIIIIIIIIPWCYSLTRDRAYQMSAGYLSTCPQKEINDHPTSLR